MRRREFLALAVAGLASVAGCGHNYRFQYIPAEAPLFVNTARTHYKMPMGWEEARKKLILLAREGTSPMEEIFVHSESEGMLYEVGYDEKTEAGGGMSVVYDSGFLRRFGQGDTISVCHIHPLSNGDRSVAKRLMQKSREAVMMLRFVDFQAQAEGREIKPETRRLLEKFEYVTSYPEIETRDILLPFLAIPSPADFGNAYDARLKTNDVGLRLRCAVASPFGITELAMEPEPNDFLRLGKLRARQRYSEFVAETMSHEGLKLLLQPQAELDRLAEKHGGAFRLVFTDAIELGLEPYVLEGP
ncbi:MAG: hypothetical protein FJY76_02055 [Candidatus Aenigmarchaeota archaeon]|nr:hypothetical protein [Candidatus Aenigmarchaeota archaeon]